jgi:hypothetical protein
VVIKSDFSNQEKLQAKRKQIAAMRMNSAARLNNQEAALQNYLLGKQNITPLQAEVAALKIFNR